MWKPVLGILFIIYPPVQALLALKGVDLPSLGEIGNLLIQGSGAGMVAKSDKLGS